MTSLLQYWYDLFDCSSRRSSRHVISRAAWCATFAAAFWASATIASAPSKSAAAKPGIAIALGGAVRADNDAVWARVVALAGGRGARFAVLATAADEPEKSAASIIANLERHGATAEHVPVAPQLAPADVSRARAAARDPANVAQIRNAQGIFFSGGAQERITDALLEADGGATPVMTAIRDLFNRGGVVAGTSAGAAIMSQTMFRDPPDVLTIMQNGVRGLREGQDIDRGLGFVADSVFVDQHFIKRGRIGRMLVVLAARGLSLGVGVEEDSGAVFRGDDVEIIGRKGALIVDLAQAARGPTHDKPDNVDFHLRDVKLSYLEEGDRINLKTRVVTPSAWKAGGKRINPSANDFKPYHTGEPFFADILGDATIVRAMTQVVDGKASSLKGLAFRPPKANPTNRGPRDDLAFEFQLRRGTDSLAFYRAPSAGGGGDGYTVLNVMLDVTPVSLASPLYRSRVQPSATVGSGDQRK